MVEDILVQGSGSEVLRIAADELALVFRGVGEVDEVVDDVDKAVLTEQSRHHCLQRGDAAVGLVLGVDLAPGVEEFVGGVECAEFVVHAVGDDDEGGVFEQRRDVAAVADGQLLVGILDGGVLLDGALELEHHDRQAVQEDDGIRDAMLVPYDVVLIDNLEDIMFLLTLFESDGLDIKVLLGRVLAFQREAVHQQVHRVAVLFIQRAARPLGDDADGRLHLLLRDAVVLVAAAEILRKVVAQHHLVEVAHDVLALDVVIPLLLQQGDNRHL